MKERARAREMKEKGSETRGRETREEEKRDKRERERVTTIKRLTRKTRQK